MPGSPGLAWIIYYLESLTEFSDEKKASIVVFMDVKKDGSALTWTQVVIKRAVGEKAVGWVTMKIADE